MAFGITRMDGGILPVRMRVPDEFIELLRQKVDIVDIVSEYVRLKRAGHSFVGLCPFHAERTPSFSVSKSKGFYYCFGCGAGGSVIQFLMEIEQLSFVEAIEHLANRAGLNLPDLQGAEEESQDAKWRNGLLLAHDLAAKFYNHILMNHDAGTQALSYLLGRGLSKKTVARFALGYSPPSGTVLVKFLRSRGIEERVMFEAGLALQTDRGEPRDRFRGRVMFPIWDTQGRAIAFGARALRDEEPKYLNTGETALFRKGRQLYGYHLARQAIRQSGQVILLEGYMDVIGVQQRGIANAVAGMGTALSTDQAGLLRRVAEEVVVLYDGDAAGQRAAKAAIETLRDLDVRVKVARMPAQTDPDEWIREHGPEAFRAEIVGRAVGGLSFLLTDLTHKHPDHLGSGRIPYLRDAVSVVAQEDSPLEREAALEFLGRTYAISVAALREDLRQRLKEKREAGRTDRSNKSWNTVSRAEATDPVATQSEALPERQEVAARELLTYMLLDAGVAKQVQSSLKTEFPLPLQSALQAYLASFYMERDVADPALFLSGVDDPRVAQFAASLLQAASTVEEDGVRAPTETLVHDYIQCMIDFGIEQDIDRVSALLKEAGQRGDFQSMRVLQEDLKRLIGQLNGQVART